MSFSPCLFGSVLIWENRFDENSVDAYLSCGDLCLLDTPDFLHPVLSALLLLSGGLCCRLNNSLSPQPELGFEFLGGVHGVVDQSEASSFAATEVGLEPERKHTIGSALVHLGQFFTNFGFGH